MNWHPFITISAVTEEFGAFREPLQRLLSKPHIGVHIQEAFGPSACPLLDKLEDYIRSSACVIHLVGDKVGYKPAPPDVAAFLERRPDLINKVLFYKDVIREGVQLSYTQWEAVLAIYHGRALAVFQPDEGLRRHLASSTDESERLAQDAHLRRLNRWPTPFSGIENLIGQIYSHHDILPLWSPPRDSTFRKSTRLRLGSEPELAKEDEATTVKRRRDVLGRPVAWDIVRRGRYYLRRELVRKLATRLDEWRETPPDREGTIPVFWLGGRSGDGKSVLLLQLVADLLQREPGNICVKAKPSDLIEAMREVSNSAGHAFIVIDDLFAARNIQDDFFPAVATAFEGDLPVVPILTCGPTPEMEEFKGLAQHRFEIVHENVPNPTRAEIQGLTEWLGSKAPLGGKSNDLLVECLFELQEHMPLDQFAKSFSSRLEAAGGKLLKQQVTAILATNGLDLPADTGLLSQGRGKDFVLDTLSDELQRHFNLDEEKLFANVGEGSGFPIPASPGGCSPSGPGTP